MRLPHDDEWLTWRGHRWATDGYGLWREGWCVERPEHLEAEPTRGAWLTSVILQSLAAIREPERPLEMHPLPMIGMGDKTGRVLAEIVDGRGRSPVVLWNALIPDGVDEWQGATKLDPVWGFVDGDAVCVVMPLRVKADEWKAWRERMDAVPWRKHRDRMTEEAP